MSSDVSADLDSDLANLINLLFERPPIMEGFLKLKEEIKRPGNCQTFKFPKFQRPSGGRYRKTINLRTLPGKNSMVIFWQTLLELSGAWMT